MSDPIFVGSSIFRAGIFVEIEFRLYRRMGVNNRAAISFVAAKIRLRFGNTISRDFLNNRRCPFSTDTHRSPPRTRRVADTRHGPRLAE